MGVVIRTDRLELRALDDDGARAVLRGDPPDGVLWAEGYPLPSSRDAAAHVLDSGPAADRRDPFASFQILRRDEPYVIGDCGFGAPPDSDGAVEIRWRLVERLHGRGLESEALEALIGFAFTRDEVVCVRASTPAGDSGGRRVLERAGMMAVGEDAERIYFEA
jgi:RimJ/RimL family protein N-acetyltransferase